jgi:20S proteasome alpha/beta subunit
VTLIIGFVGPDGAVMACDSQATEADRTKYPVSDKVWLCNGMLIGFTGNTSVKDVLVPYLEAQLGTFGELDRWKAREALRQLFGEILKREYDRFVPSQAGMQPIHKIGSALLILGRDNDGYWLLELDAENTPCFQTDRGFHAVGSGSVPAQVAHGLLSHYEPKGRSTAQLRLLAYRTVDVCIQVADLGVGPPIHVWESSEGDGFRLCGGEELDQIRSGLLQWTTIERESLDLAAGRVPEDGDGSPETPIPEPLEGGAQAVTVRGPAREHDHHPENALPKRFSST